MEKTTPEIIVKLSNVSRVFKEDQVPVNAVVGINLIVHKGDFIALMGASGSGKSTLLNIIGLIEKIDSGEITIAGKIVSKMSESDQAHFRLHEIGYVFQFLNLFEELNIFENVCLPLKLLGRYNGQEKKRATDLLNYLGLGDRLLSYPNELSGGQQQKVALARALIKKPSIILADEPTANLDSKSAIMIVELLEKIRKDFNQTIILVTHEPNLGAMADKIVEVRDGEIIGEKPKTRDGQTF